MKRSMTGEDLRRLALAFPGALEKPHFDRAGFRVEGRGGRMFATLPADGESANLMLGREEQALLVEAEPEIFHPVPNKWGENGATTVVLARTDEATLRSALTMAWRRAAPKKLVEAFDAKR